MGAGTHGGFGIIITKESPKKQQKIPKHSLEPSEIEPYVPKEPPLLKKMPAITMKKRAGFPKEYSQIKHIMGKREGHLPDTPQNRKMLVDLANNYSKFIGVDRYGNSWHADLDSSGRQNWVRYRKGIINNGGRNVTAREWNPETGLNKPFSKRKGGKK